MNQRVAQMLLKRLGYRADCVADGIECIRSLERRPYDVVLMDLSVRARARRCHTTLQIYNCQQSTIPSKVSLT